MSKSTHPVNMVLSSQNVQYTFTYPRHYIFEIYFHLKYSTKISENVNANFLNDKPRFIWVRIKFIWISCPHIIDIAMYILVNSSGHVPRTITKCQRKKPGHIYCQKCQPILKLAKSIKAGWLQPFAIRREKSSRTDIFQEARGVKYWSEILKMMLQWLILLTLFVHNSLAFGLYDDTDGMCY